MTFQSQKKKIKHSSQSSDLPFVTSSFSDVSKHSRSSPSAITPHTSIPLPQFPLPTIPRQESNITRPESNITRQESNITRQESNIPKGKLFNRFKDLLKTKTPPKDSTLEVV